MSLKELRSKALAEIIDNLCTTIDDQTKADISKISEKDKIIESLNNEIEKRVYDKINSSGKKVNKIKPCAVKFYDEKGEEKIGFAVDFTLKQEKEGDVLPSKYFTVEEDCLNEKLKDKSYNNNEIWTCNVGVKTWKPYQLVIRVFGKYHLINISNVEFLGESGSIKQ